MNSKELDFILQEGEGLKIEFKESFDAKALAKEIVAFANSEGGRIFLGVTDEGKIKGIKKTNRIKSQIIDLALNCDPKISLVFEEFNKIIIICVENGKNKPYKCSSGFYLRQGLNSQKMTRNQILEFAVSEGKKRFDEEINPSFNFKNDFDSKKLDSYLELANISKTLTNEKILLELDVAIKSRKLFFNNAGVLFFSKNPQRFISHSIFTCVLFGDKEGSNILDRKEIKGNLFDIVKEVMQFIEMNTRVAYSFTGKPKREEIHEYPTGAIREAVINSVVHKDYYEQGHNNILRIFPDNLTITNVWTKPSWFRPGRDTFRRNKIIADLFFRIGLIEKIGSGFSRMKEFCKSANASIFKLDIDEKYFSMTFYKSKKYLEIVDKSKAVTSEKSSEKSSEKIVDLINKNNKITISEIAKILNLSTRAVEKNLLKLKKHKILERVGPDKGGHWKIIK